MEEWPGFASRDVCEGIIRNSVGKYTTRGNANREQQKSEACIYVYSGDGVEGVVYTSNRRRVSSRTEHGCPLR